MWTALRSRWAFDALLIFLVTILGMLLLIANPGYFSHDELQKLDHVGKYGFWHYISSYVVLVKGEGFGTPVRPISFFVQGVLALAMKDYPVLVHFVDVLTHGTVAVLAYSALLRFAAPRVVALGATIIFALNPMAVIAVGWPAALMDRWYVLFGTGALLYADSHVRGRSGWTAFGLIFVLTLAAILSKETAIMLPGLMLLFVLREPSALKSWRFWSAGAAMALPALTYILYRLPAILASFEGGGSSSYIASLGNISHGLLVYLAYPFLVTLTEAVNWVFVSPVLLSAALATHLAIVAVLWRAAGWRVGSGYVFCYFLFLIPVLFIPIKAAHYLYASSIFFSIALSWMALGTAWCFSPRQLFSCLALMLVLLHTFVLQGFMYRLGSCMNTTMTGIEAAHMTLGKPEAFEMRAEPGAPAHVLHRLSTGRDKVGDSYPVRMRVVDWDEPWTSELPVLIMDHRCRVYVK